MTGPVTPHNAAPARHIRSALRRNNSSCCSRHKNSLRLRRHVTQPNSLPNGLERPQVLFRPRTAQRKLELMNIQTDPSLLKGVVEPLPASADQPIRSTFYHEANLRRLGEELARRPARRARVQAISNSSAASARTAKVSSRSIAPPTRRRPRASSDHARGAVAARQPLPDRGDGLPGQARPAAPLLPRAAGRLRSAAASRSRARWRSPGPMSRIPTARSRPRCSRRSSRATSRSSR